MSGDRPHVLIIEDNDDFARLLSGMLEQEYSAEVAVAGTLAEGRALLSSGRWDLVSLDYRVGDEDGLTLLSEIAASGDGPPVIMVTGQGQERLAAQSVELGASGYVIKDLKMRETFLASVGRVLAEEAQRRAERSLLEQADELRVSEERYRILTGNISDVIWTANLELNFTYVSPAIFARTGYTVEEALGLSMDEVITPESLQMVYSRFAEEMVRQAETNVDPPVPVVVEVEQYRKDGTTFPVEVSGGFLRGEDGTPYGILGVNRDITERKKAEAALRASEERYRILTSNMSDVIWSTDLEFNFTYLSPSVFGQTGYTAEEVMSLGLDNIINPESLEKVNRRFVMEMARAMETNLDPPIPTVLEIDQYRKDGTTFPAEVSVGFLREPDGKPYGILGVTRDITERKKAEEALRLTQFTVDHAGDSVLWTTPEGEIIYANEEACRRRGYTLEEMLSLKVSDINADMSEDPDLWLDTVSEIERDGHFTREFRHWTKDGEVFPVEATVNRLDFEGREIFVANLRDITERKRDEEEIRTLNRHMEGILSSVADGILTLGLDRTIVSVNPAAERITGYSGEELVGNSTRILYASDEDYAEAGDAMYPQVLEEGYTSGEIRAQRADGAVVPVELSMALMEEEGEPSGVVIAFRDISERRAAEESLRESEERFRLMATASQDAIIVVGPDFTFRFFNEAAERILGYTSAEVIGRSAVEIMAPPEFRDDLRGEMESFSQEGTAFAIGTTLELIAFTKDGSRIPVETSSAAVQVEGEWHALVSMRDVSGRKRAERLAALQRDLAVTAAETVDAEQVIRAAVEAIPGLTGLTSAGIYTIDEASGELELAHQVGLSEGFVAAIERCSADSRNTALVMEGNPIVLDNKQLADLAPESELEGLRTCAVVPLRTAEGLVGALNVAAAEEGAIGPELINVLETIAGQVAQSISRARLAAAVRESEDRFRTMARAANDAIMTVGSDLKIHFWNDAAERIFGFTSDEALGADAIELLGIPGIREETAGQVELFAWTGQGPAVGATAEYTAVRKDGTVVPVEVSSAAMQVGGEWHALISVRDISDRKRAERLAALQRDLTVVAAQTADAREVIRVTVEAVPELTGLDMASIYLVDEETGDLNLIDYVGASEGFAASVAYYPADAVHVGLLMAGEIMFVGSENIAEAVPAAAEEGATAFVIVPLRTSDGVIGCLNMGSHERDSIPEEVTNLLETLAGQVALAISRARLAAAVRAGEEKYRQIYENAGEGIFSFDLNMMLVDVNPRVCELVGYTREELVGRHIFDLGILHQDDIGLATEAIGRIVSGEARVVADEFRFITKDGRVLDMVLTGAGVYDESGELVGVTNIAADVTEERRATRELKEREERLSIITGSIGDIVAYLDRDGYYRYMSPSFERVLGYEPSGVIGINISDLIDRIHPEDRGAIERNVERMPPQTNNYSFLYRYMHADGRYVWLESVAGPLLGADGVSMGTVITSRDVTDRVRVADAQRESERRYREMLETVHLGAVLLDREGRITYINDYLAGLSGWKRDEALGRDWFETFIPPEAREPMRQRFIDGVETGTFEPETVENEIVTRSGKRRVIRWYITVLRDETGAISGSASLGEDVTQRRVALQALATSREQLRALSRHLTEVREDERSDLARELHDELGQSLTGLKMDAVWLERTLIVDKPDLTQLTERLHSMADMIDSNIGVVRRIASGLRPGILDDLGLVPALEWTVEDFSFRTGIAAECHSELGDVDLDQFTRTQVFRIVQEALTNVARHSGARHVKVRVGRDDGRLTVEVGDDGAGISREAVASRDSLGIVGMHERARLIGGELVVSGDREEGTSVVLKVPSFEDDGGPD
ncbi:MAG: PAS domain S-box protein [Actinomycetota bacterium]